MKKILVLEDEANIRSFVVINLRRSGFEPIEAENGEMALEKLKQNPDICLALLDVMLPDIDGFEVCRRIRATGSKMGIIMLTAKSQEIDKVTGLMTGADDYVTKPFAIEELLARIRAALRTAGGRQESQSHQLTAGPVTLDLDSRKVTVNDTPVELTRREFDLLACLLEHKGKVLSRSAILNTVWGYDYVGETNTVDVYIRFLRSKLDEVFGIHLIETVRGVGYVIRGD